MFYKKNWPLFLSIFFLLNCSSKNAFRIKSLNGNEISKKSFDKHLTSRMEKLNIPGLSIAIINEGKVVHHQTLGYANKEEKVPVTDKTIFEGASMSKSVFAFFVMNFVEEGKLELDKPLYQYLPYDDIAYDDRYKKITARMVLSHRSGFPNWRPDKGNGKLEIKFEPGTDYQYSGEGYQYLAMVLKHIENTGWSGLEAIFQEKIAKPLGLKHTVFIPGAYTMTHKANPYNDAGISIPITQNSEFGAAYSIHSESIEFSKWMIAVMQQDILKESSYDELFKPHSKMPAEGIDLSYGLGFVIPDLPFIEANVFMHTGDNDGFTCWYTLDTTKDWGFVLFTNSEYGQTLGEELLFYLITGYSFTQFLIIGVVVLIVILVVVGFSIKFLIRKIRARKKAISN